ncbi:hypothetical protein L083_3143 [Actinoplanes sp. N902-109]|nr:hypothetical protein L083_3143 [Actinoplanes sp. N902-109]
MTLLSLPQAEHIMGHQPAMADGLGEPPVDVLVTRATGGVKKPSRTRWPA